MAQEFPAFAKTKKKYQKQNQVNEWQLPDALQRQVGVAGSQR